jgi:hypothetical protein
MKQLGVIRDIEKGRGEIIRIELSEYKGNTYLNLRVWYTDKDGEYKPTQKGVSFTTEQYQDLKEAILEAGERI